MATLNPQPTHQNVTGALKEVSKLVTVIAPMLPSLGFGIDLEKVGFIMMASNFLCLFAMVAASMMGLIPSITGLLSSIFGYLGCYVPAWLAPYISGAAKVNSAARGLSDSTQLAERGRISKEIAKITANVTQVYIRSFVEHVPSGAAEGDKAASFQERAEIALENTIIDLRARGTRCVMQSGGCGVGWV